jgi:hypothetical protein
VNRKNASAGKPALNARIGIETGPVVVDAAGEIYGDAPNVAARVQALAEPGTVVGTARVQRQVAGLFVVEERGNHELKGVPEPVTLYRLVRASGAGRRAGQRRLTPLVGRDEEIAMLLRRWERARQGEGQLVVIAGEPGLGKSRLIEEFHARLRDTPHTWVEWSCSQLLQSTPLHPIAEWGRQRYGGADVPAEKRLADLENSLGQMKLDPRENAALLAPLFDIPLPPDRALAFPPEELRRRQLLALTAGVMASARVQPVVLALEDVHWADPTTIDVVRGIAERGALAPLFVLITARPEFRPSWGARSHHGTISLVPLDRHQVRHMVEELAARHTCPRRPMFLARNEVVSKPCHWHTFPPSPRLSLGHLGRHCDDDLTTLSFRKVGDHRGQDARTTVSSGPSSNENNTCIISFVLTFPFMSLSMTRSCWASGRKLRRVID